MKYKIELYVLEEFCKKSQVQKQGVSTHTAH